MYLGTDVLKDDEGNFVSVQWKGYMGKRKAYQGELLNKLRYKKPLMRSSSLLRQIGKMPKGKIGLG